MHVHDETDRRTEGQQGSESVLGYSGDAYSVAKDHAIKRDYKAASQKTFLLGKNREDKIVMRHGSRQVTQFCLGALPPAFAGQDRKSTRLNSSHVAISYAVFCLQ